MPSICLFASRIATSIAISVLFAALPAQAQDGDRPRLYTNQRYVEDVLRPPSLAISNPMAIFAFVLQSLPARVKVYPTENYYYFYFYDGGTKYAGNIRLDVTDRDKGKVHFAYYVDHTDWKIGDPDAIIYRLLGAAEGVGVERLEPLLYRVSYDGTSVVFELNDLSAVSPPASALAPDDRYLGPIFDEAALRFFLVYNTRLKGFHYILDETEGVADEFFPSQHSDRILIGRRTGFAFYRDHHLERKILIGVYEPNIVVNNYYDGPFDQLPDNFIVGEALRQAILDIEPELAGKIGRLGAYADDSGRYLIAPYLDYRSEDELNLFHQCATDPHVPREQYYACFIIRHFEHDGTSSDPQPHDPKAPKQ